MDIFFNVVGWIATVVGIAMFAPQSWKTVRTKDTKQLSTITFTVVAAGIGFWTIYTIGAGSYQGWTANAVILTLMFPILYYIYGRKNFLFVLIPLAGLLATSIIIWILGLKLQNWMMYVLVVIASALSGPPYFVQVYKTMKSRNAESLSLLTCILVCVNNILWTVYWSFLYAENPSDGSALIVIISVFLTASAQLPLIYGCFKFSKANNTKNSSS